MSIINSRVVGVEGMKRNSSLLLRMLVISQVISLVIVEASRMDMLTVITRDYRRHPEKQIIRINRDIATV